MTEMPVGWERDVLTRAIAGAGFRATVHSEVRPMLSLNYGAPGEPPIHVTVLANPGSMVFVARAPGRSFPVTQEWLMRANDTTIDWGLGRLSWDAELQAPETATALFVYPDRVPPPEEVHEACHQLWLARELLVDPAAGVVPYHDVRDLRDASAFAARFADVGFPLVRQGDGSYAFRFDTGDDGTFVLRLSMERPGVLMLDGLSPLCPEWPEDGRVWDQVNALNVRLVSSAVTRWGTRMVVRKVVPTAWIPDHPQWVTLMLDHLSWAVMDVVRIGRGGPIARPET